MKLNPNQDFNLNLAKEKSESNQREVYLERQGVCHLKADSEEVNHVSENQPESREVET